MGVVYGLAMRTLLLFASFVLCCAALEDPSARLAAIDKEAATKKEAYLRAWLATANLDPVPVPALANPQDARPSEARANFHAKKINDALKFARQVTGKEQGSSPLYDGPSAIWHVADEDIRKAIIEAQSMHGGAVAER
jgi:hypothetical protein